MSSSTSTSTSTSTNITLPLTIFSPLNSLITNYLSNSTNLHNPIRLAKSLNGIELEAFYRQSSDIPKNPTNLKVLNGVVVDKDYIPPTTIATDINIAADNDKVISSDAEGWIIIDEAVPSDTRNSSVQQHPQHQPQQQQLQRHVPVSSQQQQQPKKQPESIFTAVIQSLLNTQTEVLRSEASSSLSDASEASEEMTESDYYYGEELEKYDVQKSSTIASINLSEEAVVSSSTDLSFCMSKGFHGLKKFCDSNVFERFF